MTDFGENLTRLMSENHITAYRLAKDLDVHQSTIKNWIDGKTIPSSSKLHKIAEAFDISVDRLMGFDETVIAFDDPYFVLIEEARKNGITPDDIRIAVNTLSIPKGAGKTKQTLEWILSKENETDIKRTLYLCLDFLNEEGQKKLLEYTRDLLRINDCRNISAIDPQSDK